MIIFLFSIIIILIFIIILLILKMKNNDKAIDYIDAALGILSAETANDRIRYITDDKKIKKLCHDINNLIDKYYKLKLSEAESREAMKKMLSNVSHDLRTPLTVILGYIDQLNHNQSLSIETRNDYMLKLEAKTGEVITLMNEFFTLSKLESGDNNIKLSKINLSEVVREVVLNFYESLEAKSINMDINIPEDDIYCLGNKEALERVLNNLITNSIKYGSDGNVIGIKVFEDKELVWIEEWDKGKGIAETERSRVFERLYTLEDSRNKNYQGSGLGLSIVKTLINKMNGDITLESIPYKKTCFKFYLKNCK